MTSGVIPPERGTWYRRAMWMRKQGCLLKNIAADLGVSVPAVSVAVHPEAVEHKRAYNRDYMRRRRAKESAVKSVSTCE